MHPTIIISIPDSSNNKCSREYIFKDGEGGLWFYATLASNGKIKLEMGDRILLQYGYDYYGKKGAAYNNGYK
ncbi:MAG: hypothetical protein Q7U47_01995 [Paludibacter sp.]|nr:hypothetical protein [Paludibacter sp.]